MQYFRSLRIFVTLLLPLAAACALSAQEGLSDAFARLQACCSSSQAIFGPSLVTADFNHDKHTDGAILLREHNSFRIELHFRHNRSRSISFASSLPALQMRALDVNKDGNPDLVVEDPFSRRWLFVWLNDGHGGFQSAPLDSYSVDTSFSYPSLVSPSCVRDSDLLLGPGKMRTRNASSFAHRIAKNPFRFRLSDMHGQRTPSEDPVPNLVRGSPLYISL